LNQHKHKHKHTHTRNNDQIGGEKNVLQNVCNGTAANFAKRDNRGQLLKGELNKNCKDKNCKDKNQRAQHWCNLFYSYKIAKAFSYCKNNLFKGYLT
jgi:hypothetical protein